MVHSALETKEVADGFRFPPQSFVALVFARFKGVIPTLTSSTFTYLLCQSSGCLLWCLTRWSASLESSGLAVASCGALTHEHPLVLHVHISPACSIISILCGGSPTCRRCAVLYRSRTCAVQNRICYTVLHTIMLYTTASSRLQPNYCNVLILNCMTGCLHVRLSAVISSGSLYGGVCHQPFASYAPLQLPTSPASIVVPGAAASVCVVFLPPQSSPVSKPVWTDVYLRLCRAVQRVTLQASF